MGAAVSKEFVAGFWVGEGHASINKSGTGYVERIGFTNCDDTILKKVQKVVGGILRVKQPKNEKWRTGYSLNLSAKESRDFARDYRQYVVGEKAEKLELLYQCSLLDGGKHKQTFYHQLIELNKRGPKFRPVQLELDLGGCCA